MIPKEVREKVLMQWIKGNSRDEIARSLEIGAGTVSGISMIADILTRILTWLEGMPYA
jgi:DNA-directed RNA polymerase specialized sigma24 family protein